MRVLLAHARETSPLRKTARRLILPSMARVADSSTNFLAAAAGIIMLAGGAPGAVAAERLEGPLPVAEVIAGDLARLADGRIVRLAGIRVPAADSGDRAAEQFAELARAELSALLDGQAVTLALADAPYDRYGRLVAHIERADGVWLQGALLERGLAQVQTRPGETARADQMLAIEQAARAARRGLWAEPAWRAQDATALAASAGRFRIVRGRVLRVAPTERYVYLNFGGDWRADFTVRAERADLAGPLAGLDVAGLAGRVIEVRGVVLEAGGPLIELSHPEQIQILP
jgi:endonuclease YncB( thermonuclease family)